ncbi:MAG: hypothetical protein GJ671_03630 [Alteromonadaceae bacterium]|nr:hypothetical protein [Alteromonadaceae bacterium]
MLWIRYFNDQPNSSSGAGFELPKIAIIIDDVGRRSSDTRLQSLPGEVAFSILPDSDFAT